MPVVRSRKEAAEILGIVPRVLGDWARAPWFPEGATERDAKGKRFNWNTEVIAHARDAMGRKGSTSAEESHRVKLLTDEEKLERQKIARRHEELELAEKEGELVPRRAVELHFATLLTELGDWCEQLPDLIAGDVPAKIRPKLKARIKDELDRRRRELSAELQRQARELETRKAD